MIIPPNKTSNRPNNQPSDEYPQIKKMVESSLFLTIFKDLFMVILYKKKKKKKNKRTMMKK